MEGLAASTEYPPPPCSVVVEPPSSSRPPTLPTAYPHPTGGSASDPAESDTVKLFVGQVPKNFEEKDLEPVLLEYGPIHELTILRDRINGSHKGSDHTMIYITIQ